MRLAIASDVHLEFGDCFFDNEEQADVLILAGDICKATDLKDHDVYGIMEGTRSNRMHEFFIRCSERFPHVIYVAGNHEHYDGDFTFTTQRLKDKLSYLKNLHVLDKEMFTLGDVRFIGGTLWTDMNNQDPLTLFHMKSMMSDYKLIRNSANKVTRKVPLYKPNPDFGKDPSAGKYLLDENGYMIPDGFKFKEEAAMFSPEDSVEEFRKMKQYLEVCTAVLGEDTQKYVVVTHHTPSMMSCAPHYRGDTLMNGAYHNSFEDFIMDKPSIKLWVHGHTHDDFDYTIGDTRVVCNPRGYVKYESRVSTWKVKYVDV